MADNPTHVVAISGGKDSVAMALRLREVYPDTDYQYLITPVGNEPPELEDHWNKLEGLLGKPLTRLQVFEGDGLHELIRQQNMIPNFRARFCTRILKIEPTVKYLKQHAPCIQYVGLRADEEERKGLYGDTENVSQKYPLREWGWGIKEVWAYLDEKKIEIPERTDCQLCFFQRLIEWKRLWLFHREAYERGIAIEEKMGATFRSPSRDTWPASLRELAAEFESGRKVRGEDKFLKRDLSDCDREALCRVCTL